MESVMRYALDGFNFKLDGTITLSQTIIDDEYKKRVRTVGSESE